MASDEILEQEDIHLKNTASLLVHAAGWLADKKFEANGGTIFYAVDVDVCTFFLAPKNNAKYADIFNQKDEASQLLAWLLADFIFFEADGLTISRPLFLLPPHAEELEKMVDTLCRKVTSYSNKFEVEMTDVASRLQALISNSESASILTSAKSLAEWLGDNAKELIRIFEDRANGPELELKRFAEIAHETVITPLHGKIIPKLNLPFPSPDIENDIDDANKFSKVKYQWNKRLLKHKSQKTSEYLIDNDAEALACLEWANNELAATQVRLVLITGDEALGRAAQEHPDEHFALRYIRHPRSFLAAKEMFALSRPDDGVIKADLIVMEWLNLFFPDAIRQVNRADGMHSEIDGAVVKKILDNQLANPKHFWEALRQLIKVENTSILNDYVDEWGRHINAIATARKIHPKLFPNESGAVTKIAEILLRHFSQPEDESIPVAEKVYQEIYSSSVSSLDQLYSAPAWIGLWSNAAIRNNRIIGIPALRFDGDSAAQNYADSVMAGLTGTATNVNLVRMYAELSKVDESNYLAHVVHALAYASKGHWYATTALCRVAVAVRDCLPKEQRGDRTGREAAYLASVAFRRMAQRAIDLNTAEEWLNQAHERNQAENPDPRFLSQRLAISTTRHSFAFFSNDPKALNLAAAQSTYRSLGVFISGIDEFKESSKEVEKWLFRQGITNFFLVEALIKAAAKEFAVIDQAYSASLLDKFDYVTQHRLPKSFSRYIFKLAYVMHGHVKEKRAEIAHEIIHFTPPYNMPYDEKRHALFKSIAADFLITLH